MTAGMTFGLASGDDLASLADLRWRLKTEDAPGRNADAYRRFVDAFVRIETAERAPGEVFHWLACADEKIIAAMSVIIVRKVAAPGRLQAKWGYLTNCYVLPEHRGAGVGGAMVQAIQSWAAAQQLELLIVWPSERSFPFYARSGFQRPVAPLVWTST